MVALPAAARASRGVLSANSRSARARESWPLVVQKVAARQDLERLHVRHLGVTGAVATGALTRRGKKNEPIAYLFLLPAMAVLGVFHFFPFFYAFYVSLHNWRIRQGAFVALENYQRAVRTRDFWEAFGNTAFFALGTVPVTIALALFFAYLLFQNVRFLSAFRTIYFLPYITSSVAAATIWVWIFNTRTGVLNQTLKALLGPQYTLRWLQEPRGVFGMLADSIGVTLPRLLQGPSLALVAIMVMTVWHLVGFDIVLFLAGLGNINRELYEAARIDGAREWDLFRRITLPLLSPTILFLAIISTIGSFKAFNEIFVMSTSAAVGGTAGGPLNSTQTVVVYIYNLFYSSKLLGFGSAVAFLLFLLILLLTLAQLQLGRRRDAL